MFVKIMGTYVDSPVMTVGYRREAGYPTALISVGSNVQIELTTAEALALAADLIRAVNR
jgi:hypothetical protein